MTPTTNMTTIAATNGNLARHTVPLEIHFWLADGSSSRFVVDDADAAQELLAAIQPGHLFTTPEFVIGSSHSLTLIRAHDVDSIDFIMPGYPGWQFAPRVRDAVEITAEAFAALVSGSAQGRLSLSHGLRSANIGLEGDDFHACVELRLRSGRKLYHAQAMTSDPQSPVDRGLSLSHLFSRSAFIARLPGGGATIVNPAHVTQATLYPGPSETPPNAWLARRAADPALPAIQLVAAANGRR